MFAYLNYRSIYYIHTDHLGSYCTLTDAAKQVVQRNFFDPWGNSINQFRGLPPGDPQLQTPINFTLTPRGFTGHEHYPYFKIINMNGRLYDPVIGRFFSPDKYVANSSFTQDFNRYSYARNCPLMYTDPNGEMIWAAPLIVLVAGAAISAVSYTIQTARAPGGLDNWDMGCFLWAMASGGANAFISNGIGNVFGAVSTTLSASSVLNELGRAGIHALAQGTFNQMGGGQFWRGAVNGAVSSIVGSATESFPGWAQIGVSTLMGGVTSKISGGTFKEGAISGFFISAFNHCLHAAMNGDPSNPKDKLKENTEKATFISALATGISGGAAENAIIEAAGELGVSVKEFVKILKAASGGEAQALKVINGLRCGTKILGVLGGVANATISVIDAINDPTPGNIVRIAVQGAIIGTACIPGIGWAISLGLTVADVTVGDYIYKLIDGKK